MWHGVHLYTLYFFIILQCSTLAENQWPWKWVCTNDSCVKTRISDPSEAAVGLAACKMFCNDHNVGYLWPKPTGVTTLGRSLTAIDENRMFLHILSKGQSEDLVKEAWKRFRYLVELNIPKGIKHASGGRILDVYLVIKQPDVNKFSIFPQENYELVISGPNRTLNATVTANTFFGIRHGLETLSQLFVYDELSKNLMIVKDANISDNPVYPYRGILLDTARNYYDVDTIKRTIDAMASVKLNTFHWHITDTQSFPFVSERRPTLSRLGAFTPSKVYTKHAIRDIVQFGLVRGVRILPEFDAPAHVGEGWQGTNLTVCFKAHPWYHYCKEPPCGQLNPARTEVYSYLQDIYADMAEAFQPDMFHMGGDEVSQNCWMDNAEIQRFMKDNEITNNFLELWNYFQTNAQKRVYKAFGRRIPLILWTNSLNSYKHVTKYLDKDEYYIQVWTTGSDPEVNGLLEKGYNLIISNYDALYLDCGFASWVGSGNNWCSPYIGWQKIYDNSLKRMDSKYQKQILGGEAAMWSEQADAYSVDFKLWPRAAALAERLWTEPNSSWQSANQRISQIRDRLIRMGIKADSIHPEWCYQNEDCTET